MLVDSHCHLDDTQFEGERDAVVERALAAGVGRMLSIGTGEGVEDLDAGIRMAERYPEVYATVGIHPQFASEANEEAFRQIERLLSYPKVLGIGEIGLDYHWQPYDKDRQESAFVSQLHIARDARKPVTIHTRDAWADTFRVLNQHWAETRLPCILHCFSGGPAELKMGSDLDCYFSFAGIVTYPKATDVHYSAQQVPLDRLLIETDAPYLPPVPFRGKRNEPAHVARTAARIAELRNTDPGSIAEATTKNFNRIFFGE